MNFGSARSERETPLAVDKVLPLSVFALCQRQTSRKAHGRGVDHRVH